MPALGRKARDLSQEQPLKFTEGVVTYNRRKRVRLSGTSLCHRGALMEP